MYVKTIYNAYNYLTCCETELDIIIQIFFICNLTDHVNVFSYFVESYMRILYNVNVKTVEIKCVYTYDGNLKFYCECNRKNIRLPYICSPKQ